MSNVETPVENQLETVKEDDVSRAEKFFKLKMDLAGMSGIKMYSAEWYEKMYPRFPEEFYPIFEQFSNSSSLALTPDGNAASCSGAKNDAPNVEQADQEPCSTA